MKYLLSISLFLMLAYASPLFAQETSEEELVKIERTPLQASSVHRATRGLSYPVIKAQEKEDPISWERDNSKVGGSMSLLSNRLIQILFVIMLLGIVVGLLLYFRKDSFFKNRRIEKNTSYTLEEIEENLEQTDLSHYISQAEQNQDYNLAIRFYYLDLLKILSQNNVLRYRKNATNRSYIRQLANTDFGPSFKNASSTFEKIWFGDRSLTDNAYHTLKEKFLAWQQEAQQFSVSQKDSTSNSSL